MASVTTHDLPPTAGYLAGDHVRLRHELGLLTRPLDEELAVDDAERTAWLDELRRRGALADDAGIEEMVTALHRFLTWTPARLLCVALTDAVGDRRTQNQPGTVDEYPNWRVPLTGPDGAPMLLEDVFAHQPAGRRARRGGPGRTLSPGGARCRTGDTRTAHTQSHRCSGTAPRREIGRRAAAIPVMSSSHRVVEQPQSVTGR